nr:MAG TPA: hypothetical protein [Caudoviricetes sp.]
MCGTDCFTFPYAHIHMKNKHNGYVLNKKKIVMFFILVFH